MTASRKQDEPEDTVPIQSDEDRFRATLADVIVVVKKLAPFCRNPADLVGMCETALTNEGQLAMLWEQMNPTSFRR